MSKEAIRANIKPNAPIREPIERKCPECGGKMEESHRECAIVCYGCFLARSIPNPRRYMHREKYDQLPITLNHPVRNAIKKPKTGLSFLDQERKFLWLLCRNRREALDLCDREQRQGKDESEYWHPKCIN